MKQGNRIDWTPERRSAHSIIMKETWARTKNKLVTVPSTPFSHNHDFEVINDIAPPYVTENILRQAFSQLQETVDITDVIIYYSRQLNKYIVVVEVENFPELHHRPTS